MDRHDAISADDLRHVLRGEDRRIRRRQSVFAVVVVLLIPPAILAGAFAIKALFYVP